MHYFVNVIDKADGKIKIWQMSKTMYKRIIDAMKPDEVEAFASVVSTTPPQILKEYVCADCGNEQTYQHECVKCHSRRVPHIKDVEELFGPNWRDCFSQKPG